jgi:hypothetical protein
MIAHPFEAADDAAGADRAGTAGAQVPPAVASPGGPGPDK